MPDSLNNLYSITGSTILTQSILDVFVLQNIIDFEDAERLRYSFKTNREVEDFLIKNRIVTKDTINKAYSIMLKLPYIELKSVEIPAVAKALINEKLARRFQIVPFDVEGNVARVALSKPSDLLVSFEFGLEKILREKGYDVELFITGDSDFRECLGQYDQRKKDQLLVKKGSLPVVFLRNQLIPGEFIKKLPRDFIDKYRVAIFGQNKSGYYLLACQNPDSPIAVKIIEFLEKENGIRLEKFATSKEDIDFVLNLYDSYSKRPSERDKKNLPKVAEKVGSKITEEATATATALPEKQRVENAKSKSALKNLLNSLIGQSEPEITFDDVPQTEVIEEAKAAKDVLDRIGESAEKPQAEGAVEQKTPKESREDEIELDEKKEGPAQFIAPTDVEGSSLKGEENISEVQKVKNKEREDLESNDIGALIKEEITDEKKLDDVIKEGYVPKMVAAVINYALNKQSSDIHVEPTVKFLRIRCRVDGILRDVAKLPTKYQPPFLSRIKIMSKLKIDESRIPQDGRFDVRFQSREVDVRVSTLPTVNGEKVVMRILDKSQGILSLEDLGMQGSAFKATNDAMIKPYGIILSTGPTGSGKSTTLYAILNRISLPGVNIVTLEDPVEYEIAGINQCQIKPEIGFTFASGLRSILRQDPNVIMVGEIRDAETAGMATHAALTGHLVLSTLHTNDTAGALPRLINMGVEPFLITSSINLVIAQRLVRRICPKCKEEMPVPPKLLEELKAELNQIPASNTLDRARIPADLKLYHGKGCDECDNGYKGRVGIYEVMTITPAIESLAVQKRPANEIKEVTLKKGMITMKQDGILKCFAGLTTVDEIFQAVIES